MHIGLDAIPLTEPKTGVGHYTYELARALAAAAPADEFELLYPSRYAPIELRAAGAPALPANLRATRAAVGSLSRHWWSVGLPRHLRRSPVSVFHGTNYEVPLWGGCPSVLTVHDLSVFVRPETHLARRARRLRLRLPLMARTATLIITPTEIVRRETCDVLRADPAKVFTVPEAPREIFRPLPTGDAGETLTRLGVETPFVLAVGTIEPRKNLLTLLRAFEELARDGATPTGLRLVVAGRTGWLSEEFSARVAASAVRERVLLTGYVSDEDLRALYSSCLAFAYPSLYEGFGLPPLEAMACGAAVVASRIEAHKEVLGEDAALLFPPDDAQALAARLSELLADETARLRLSRAGLQRAAQFSWERAAQLTLEVYGLAANRKA